MAVKEESVMFIETSKYKSIMFVFLILSIAVCLYSLWVGDYSRLGYPLGLISVLIMLAISTKRKSRITYFSDKAEETVERQ